jgi:hypothetical protein
MYKERVYIFHSLCHIEVTTVAMRVCQRVKTANAMSCLLSRRGAVALIVVD